MAVASSSSAGTSKSEGIDISEAIQHLIQGKRHMLVQDFPSAVSSLQSATENFAQKYGEMANECGDAYFQYGKALLELARMETGVLGNALDGVPEEGEDSESSNSNKDQVESPDSLSVKEKEEIANEVDKALEETSRDLDIKFAQLKGDLKSSGSDVYNTFAGKFNQVSEQKKNELSTIDIKVDSSVASDKISSEQSELIKISDNFNEVVPVELHKIENNGTKCNTIPSSEKADTEDNEEEEEEEQEEEDEEQEEEGEEQVEDDKEVTIDKSPEKADEGENKETENEEKEEEISNLQLAWEVIELAKIIFERQSENNREMKLKAADTYLKLGEIAIESGNYTAADEDLTKCLEIRQKELQPDDRLIAETHFQLGIAFSFNSEFEKGRSNYEEALKVIKNKILNLEDKLANMKDKEKLWDIELEINDLKELIPEINSKIEDVEDMKKNAAKARDEALKEAFAKQKVAGTEDPSTSKDPFADSGFSSSTNSGTFIEASPTKHVSNIDHLVRKKRKADNESNEIGSPLKKVCVSTENIIPTESNINGKSTSVSGDKS